MGGLWLDGSRGWAPLAPAGFPDEAALHVLVAEAPNLLPLAGSPRLAVLGSEVRLGNGYADIIAVEDSGRPVVIEVKLGRNAEARRAVVAEVLSYAAYLQGVDLVEFRDLVAAQLRHRGLDDIEDAVRAEDQEGRIEPEAFRSALEAHLADGRLRLVLVLDEAPDDLIRLVGYLESVTTDRLAIDVITVAVYEVGGRKVLLPQRLDPERVPEAPAPRHQMPTRAGELTKGTAEFEASIAETTGEPRLAFERLVEWAKLLEAERLVELSSYRGVGNRRTLLPRLQPENVGLVTIWNDDGRPYITAYRSVFERKAPQSLPAVEALVAPRQIGRGSVVDDVGDAVLGALTEAYREAAAGGG